MSTMSVIPALEAAGNAASRTSFARWDCGLLVGLPSVVSAPPSSVPIATKAISMAATQAPIVRRVCFELDSAHRYLHHDPAGVRDRVRGHLDLLAQADLRLRGDCVRD